MFRRYDDNQTTSIAFVGDLSFMGEFVLNGDGSSPPTPPQNGTNTLSGGVFVGVK